MKLSDKALRQIGQKLLARPNSNNSAQQRHPKAPEPDPASRRRYATAAEKRRRAAILAFAKPRR